MGKNLIERLRERKAENGEQGSLILDILIGMAIFALIAFIAASAIEQYRERAYEQGAVSDANKIGTAVEAAFTDDFAYPSDATPLTPASVGVHMSKGNNIAKYTVNEADETFSVCVTHVSGGVVNAYAVYDSSKGGMSEKGRGKVGTDNPLPAECV